MRTSTLGSMHGGWFVGDFEPSIVRTTNVEVAVKRYAAGDREPSHHHKAAEEITVILSGRVVMRGRVFDAGTIVQLDRGESTDFQALEPVVTVVVKIPSVQGDKYFDA